MEDTVLKTYIPNSEYNHLLSLVWNHTSGNIELSISFWFLIFLLAVVFIVYIVRIWPGDFNFKSIEIDQAEIGVGSSKFRFKPNITDRQVAYAIWVELSTRKIGLPIDLNNDVISQIYDSWYEFFAVTRELIKTIPVTKVKRDGTQAIIKLSIEVLNEGLRPHLTQWQARFRHWYERELLRQGKLGNGEILEPQQIQRQFPQFEELKADMERVNGALIRYREKMRELVLKA